MSEQPGGPRRVPADGGRADLLAAVELVLSVPPADLSPEDSLARTDAVLLARTRLRAAELVGVRDIDTRELYALGEAGSVRTWLGSRPYAAGGGSRVTLARRLQTSPSAYAALASGTVATVTVEQALGAADRVPPAVLHAAEAGDSGVLEHPGRPDVEPAEAKEAAARVAAVLADGIPAVIGPVPDEAALKAQCRALAEDLTVPVVERLVTGFLIVARHLTGRSYRAAIRDLYEGLLPEVQPGDDDAYAHRAFTMTKHFDGWWRVDGDLTPETGDRLAAELHAEIAARARFDDAQADGGRGVSSGR